MEPKEGVALVKEGGFAYHSEVKTVYPLIAMTFDLDSICDMVEINFVTPGVVGLMAPKKSQYKELFAISLQVMAQRGMRQRALNMWIATKPECMLNLRALPIGVNELFLVYMIWLAGVLIALLLFLGELLWYKYYERPNILQM
nr:unnamed protein product [Callosobruchus chinensis]